MKTKKTKYHIVEIKTEDLEAERKSHQRKKFERVKVSSVLQVIIFKPGQPYFKAATRLCICDQYSIEYGSCEIFSEYILNVSTYCVIPLRSKDAAENADEDEQLLVKRMLMSSLHQVPLLLLLLTRAQSTAFGLCL